MKTNEFCEYLDWDLEFFGRRIGKIKKTSLSTEEIVFIRDWWRAENIQCVYFLTNCADLGSIQIAEDNQFRFKDVRITYSRDIRNIPNMEVETNAAFIRHFQEQDKAQLMEIARGNHHDTRFYADQNFPRDLCDSLYMTWIAKSCEGYADRVWVIEYQHKAIGYTSCHLNKDREGQIGLVGIHPDFQGRGFGKALIHEALTWFSTQGVQKVDVVTQGCNINAQRLYQRQGFITSKIELWYHCWPEENQEK